MIRRIGRRGLSMVLAAVCLAEGFWLTTVVVADTDSTAGVSTVPAPEIPVPLVTVAALPERTALNETLARPVFAATRRPPVIAAQTQAVAKPIPLPTPPKLDRYVLVGIVIDGDERIALLRTINSTAILRIAEGQRLEGWEVKAIESDRVVLRFGAQTLELRFPVIEPKPPTRSGLGLLPRIGLEVALADEVSVAGAWCTGSHRVAGVGGLDAG